MSSRTVTFGTFDVLREYIVQDRAAVLVIGDDRAGTFDWVSDVCEVVYLARTPSVSTTGLIEHTTIST